ncbi:MAG: hypothetical protein HRT88_12700 [Lentisphaeraceae bacterium]|nr:hypothetical protein [Lentisphaeraceae bacterium]
MAWRIGPNITYGEIDNREKGKVHCLFLLNSYPQAIKVELEGDCHADLAGSAFCFYNSRSEKFKAEHISEHQNGLCGDMTADRHVKIPLGFPEEFTENTGEVDYEWARAIYLEWFSKQHGRVVIESVHFSHYQSTALWKLSEEEERQVQENNSHALMNFMQQLQKGLDGVDIDEVTKASQEKAEDAASEAFEQVQRIHQLKTDLNYPQADLSLDSGATPMDEEEAYLRGLLSIENNNVCTILDKIPEGIEFKPSKEISDTDIEYEMWRLIYFLAASSVLLTYTNHLSDRELYELMLDKVLVDPELAYVEGGSWKTTVFAYEYADNPEYVNLKFYSTKYERIEWFEAYGEGDIPDMVKPAYSRDKQLPSMCR